MDALAARLFPLNRAERMPASKTECRADHPPRGFTLIELLTVIAIIIVLVGILLPAVFAPKFRSQGVQCLSNTKQLSVAWMMYANDYEDRLAPNREGSITSLPAWSVGVEDWRLSAGNTNLAHLRGSNALLAAYLDRNVGVFKCPGDRYLSPVQKGAGWAGRLRSYSMNGLIGETPEAEYDSPDYVRFLRQSDISVMSPSKCFVFVDEHADSVNDSWFWVMMGSNAWCDLPASYHNGSASFSFADGHSELKKWQMDYTKQPVLFNNVATRWWAPQPPSQMADIQWIQDRTSVRK
jgi:prepilin-type N-terminal cleavage/methylation domain-containing protein/prepilin-type processing-associated H-X9-DG protein